MVLFYAALAGVTFLAGGVSGSLWRTSPRVTSWLLHFAAGVVFAVLASELLPEIRSMQGHGAFPVIVGFLAGACAMVLLGWATGESDQGKRSARGLLLVVAIDVLLDGVLIGIGFAGAPRTAKIIAIGIATEMLPMGISVARSLRESGTTPLRAAMGCAGLALLPVGGAAAAAALAGVAGTSLIAGLLAFGAAALLYLVTEELLIEAHEHLQGRLDTALFFLGFAAVLFLDAAA